MAKDINFEYPDDAQPLKRARNAAYHLLDNLGPRFYEGRPERLGYRIDVSSLIKDSKEKTLYNSGEISMTWIYIKRNGEHGADNGRISISDFSPLITLEIKKGIVKKIGVFGIGVKEKIKHHPEMPLYKEITDLLK